MKKVWILIGLSCLLVASVATGDSNTVQPAPIPITSLYGPSPVVPTEQQVTLREYLQDQIKWLDRYFAAQLNDAQLAINKAESQLNARLTSMNEFRDTLKDQAGRFVTKDEMLAMVTALDRRVQILEKNLATKDELFAQTTANEKRIQTIERNISLNEGKTSITTILWAMGGSVIVALVTAFVVRVIRYQSSGGKV